jgi:DNA-binding transcriptional LysR family regulator
MDLDWLRDFLALAEHRTFSRAAETRNVTQPAFSRRIRCLEEWAGTALFSRSAQGASLTPAGRHFENHARQIVHDLGKARRETLAVGERDTAALAIAATHALSFTFFPSWIQQVTRSGRLGTLNLVSDSMAGCEQLLQSGQVHFLLCHHHLEARLGFEADRFPSVRVGDDVLTPFTAPDRDGLPTWRLPGSDTAPTPFLAYSEASGLGRIFRACRTEELSNLTTGLTSHLAATLATMAREGHGVAWLPQSLVAEDLERGKLVRAGSERFDIAIEIRLFRALSHRNRAADELWIAANAHGASALPS